MKRSIQALVVLFVSLFIVQVARAGLIDYNRLNKNKQGQQSNSSASANATSSASSGQPLDPQKFLAAKPKVKNRVEKMYDLNKNGVLDEAELIEFLKEVITAVENNGSFDVSSDILKDFDKNNDKKINPSEVRVIETIIYYKK